MHPEPLRSTCTATVVGGDWPDRCRPVEDREPFRSCVRRWRDGLSWEATGAYDLYLSLIDKRQAPVDGCSTREDLRQRFDQLDRLFDQVEQEGQLRTRSELPGASFRELGGVLVHIDNDVRPVFGRVGWHRFAIAKILDLEVAPAVIGVVHPDALATWRSSYLRRSPATR